MKYYKEGNRPKAYIKSVSVCIEELDNYTREEGGIGLSIGECLGEIIAESQRQFLIKLDCCNNGWSIEEMSAEIYDNLSDDEIIRYTDAPQTFWWVEKFAVKTSLQNCLMETE